MAKKEFSKPQEKQEDKDVISPVKTRKKTFVLMGFLVFITLFGGLILASYNFMKYRYVRSGPLTEPVVFTVPEGAGLSSLANKLEADGLIDSAVIHYGTDRLEYLPN